MNPELIQTIGYGLTTIVGVVYFLMVTLPNLIKKAKPLRDAVDRMLDSNAPAPVAPHPNGNGAATLALATLGQAHQSELARLSKAFEVFVEDNTRWREEQDAKLTRLFETTNRHELNLFEYSTRLRKLEKPPEGT